MTAEPHKVLAHRWYHNLYWRIRGVSGQDFRKLCLRCGGTGQAHFGWRICWRFKR